MLTHLGPTYSPLTVSWLVTVRLEPFPFLLGRSSFPYHERSLRSKYRSQGVQTSLYESTLSPTNSLGDKISTGSARNFGHAGTDHPYAPKERDNGSASRLTRVLLERIPGKEGLRRVASSHSSKESERTHSRTSFRMFTTSSVLSSVEKGDYVFKIDLQHAYFHVPIHPSSRKYLGFAFENRVYQFQVLHFGLNTAPQVFTRLGHTVTAYLHRQGVSVIPYLDDWLVHHPDRQILLRHQALLMHTLDLVGFILNRKKSELDLTQGLQFLGIHLRLDLGRALLPESKAGEIVACARHLSSLKVLNYSQSVPPYGFTQLGLRSYPSGSFVPENPFNVIFIRLSDKPVYATAQIRPCGPCQPTAAMAGPTFSYLMNPDPPLSGGLHNLHGRLQSGLGRSHGGFQDLGCLDPYRPQAPHQLSGAQGGYLRPTALGSSASGPPGHGRHGQFDSGFIYQQAGRDSLHFPATFDCRAFPLVRVTRHNSPGKTHSRLPERDSRPPISSESANTDRVVPTPRDRGTHLQVLGDTRSRHVCDTVELPPSSVHVSSSGAKSSSGGCSVSRLAGEVNVHVSTFYPAQQGVQKLRSTQVAEVILVAPWWPSQPWFPHLLRLCVEHPLFLPYR